MAPARAGAGALRLAEYKQGMPFSGRAFDLIGNSRTAQVVGNGRLIIAHRNIAHIDQKCAGRLGRQAVTFSTNDCSALRSL
jgi:hypothetical protein